MWLEKFQALKTVNSNTKQPEKVPSPTQNVVYKFIQLYITKGLYTNILFCNAL